MKKSATVRFFVLMAGAAALVFMSVFALTRLLGPSVDVGMSISRDRIGVVEIQGIILESKEILKSLKRFSKDRNVKGIILRIDSPGGAVAPSQEIYSALWKIHEEGEKKTVASFGNVAASGAYYVASAADRIVSNPGTITGSIGVIMEVSNIEQLMNKIGVESFVIKSGEYKDIGSFRRSMSQEEKELLQDVIQDVHQQFIEDVAKGRSMDLGRVEEVANGRIFSGRQALGLGLVDQLGSFQDAVNVIKELTGIEGEPSLIYDKPEKVNWLEYVPTGSIREFFKKSLYGRRSGAFYLMP